MSSQPQTVPTVAPATLAAIGGMRPDLTTQRCTRRLAITPKYGSAPCEVEVSYLWCGAPDAPTVIVQGGISATRDVVALDGEAAPGWWQAQVGSGLPLDLDRYRVLSIDWITPANLAGIQAVSSEDLADALAALVEALGINRVHAFIGSSYGAMVALAFADGTMSVNGVLAYQTTGLRVGTFIPNQEK